MEPLLFVAVLAAVAVLVAAVSTAVLTRRDRTPARDGRRILVEAPEHVHTYYLLDDGLVLEHYRQTAGAQMQEHSIDRKHEGTLRVGGGGVLSGEAGTGSTTHTVFAPTNDPVQAAGVVERHLQSMGQLRSFDLTAPSDNGPIENLITGLESDAGRIGLTVPGEVRDGLRRAWREHRQRIPDDLESLSSLFVRLRAEFVVGPATDGDRRLTVESHHDSGPVMVRIDCRSTHVRPSFPLEIERFTATCFGIPRWDGRSRVLTVEPLSVYRS